MSRNTNFLLYEQYLIKAFVIRPNNESNILLQTVLCRARTPGSSVFMLSAELLI